MTKDDVKLTPAEQEELSNNRDVENEPKERKDDGK